MKKKYKLLCVSIGLLSFTLPIISVISCGNYLNSNNSNKKTKLSNLFTNPKNYIISNALTNYFTNSNNQIALINYLINNNYITYSNGTWNYDNVSSYLNGYSAFTSWASALSYGISAFISSNQNISYDGMLGSTINVGDNDNNYDDDLSITNATYNSSTGLVFTITYNDVAASSNITISSTTLNNDFILIANSLTTYFSNSNNQIALINYLLKHKYIMYSNGTWNYYDSSNGSSSWASALSSGLSAFISSNQNISYDGILGLNINVGQYNYDTESNSPNDLSITNASYSSSTGLVFTITYNNANATSNIIISTTTLSNSFIAIANALTNYFTNSNNQIALINYLINNNYITYSNGTWNYDNSSWDSALSSGLSAFISRNQNISYDGILGSNIDVGQYNDNINDSNPNNLSITNASYTSSTGLVFTITYNNANATSNVSISSETLNNYTETTNSSANALTTYFSNSNNQIALINYLINNNYITYSNGTWNYDSSNGSSSLASALSYGISAFISNNQNISYDGMLGSTINVGNSDNGYDGDLSITNVSYNSSTGLVFTITYNGINASNDITISSTILNNVINTNTNVPNALTTYFSNSNNQIALINYLINNGYITYSNNTWNYDNNYSSWASALTNWLSAFIFNNQSISYDGTLGSSINTDNLSVTNASYTSSTGLVFTITCNSAIASSNVSISSTTLNKCSETINSSNTQIVNALTNYFTNSNNQIALINYLINNNYITYSNGTWNYDNVSSYLNGYSTFTSWASALSSGIRAFILNNQSISYDGTLGSSINVGDNNYDGDLSITNASYTSSTGLVFTIAYNSVSASSNVTISSTILNNVINTNTNVPNALTTYFSNSNNQIALINYLINNGYITYSNGTWNYDSSNGYTTWASALSSGISAFIFNNQSISYDGTLGSNINVGNSDNNYDGDLSVTNASYTSSTGLVFTITYNNAIASSNVSISSTTLNNYTETTNSSNTTIANALTTYFSNSNNQIALIYYLINKDYIAYSNNTWSYNTNSYSSWASALTDGLSAFISSNQNISYNGILGSSISVDQSNNNANSNNPNDLSITNASYTSSTGLVFNIVYNGANASSNVTMFNTTLNNFVKNNSLIANFLTTYFNNSNNQITLINYLLSNNYITYSNEIWSYNTNIYSSWTSALSHGISAFISNNQNISYDGMLGSTINVGNNDNNYDGDLSITNATYSLSTSLVFTIVYNGANASSDTTISTTILNNVVNSNTPISNALTTYFNVINNQIALINYLINNNYITYSNGTWNYDSSNGYSSWASALSSGISWFISSNSNISYDGILGSSIDNYDGDLSITNASYTSSTGLLFTITYNNVIASSNIIISTSTLNQYNENTNPPSTTIANILTNYFNNNNNQIALINYLLNHNYITYSNETWGYNKNVYPSWTSALVNGISNFIHYNENISYDGILGSTIMSSSSIKYGHILITNASYNSTNGLIFNIIPYNDTSINNKVIISPIILNEYIKNSSQPSTSIANALTNYFRNMANQTILINYLLNNNYIGYSYNYATWNYIDNYGYKSWDSALTNGIGSFIYSTNILYNIILETITNIGQYSSVTHYYFNDLSITNASYSSSTGLTFTITYNGTSASNNITISSKIFNSFLV